MRKTTRRAFVLNSSALAFAATASQASAETIRFKLAHNFESSHPLGAGAIELAQIVRSRSGGRLQIDVYPNGVLGGSAVLSQVRLGAVQLYLQTGGELSSIVPVAGIERLGFAFPNRRVALAAMDGGLGAYVRKEFDAVGLFIFDKVWETGFREVTSNVKPITDPDDLSGLRIRVPTGIITTDLFKTLGASPTAIDSREAYTALQTHVVDAAEGSYVNILDFRMNEVQKYLSVTNHQWGGTWCIANGEAYRALPPDLQAILRNASNQVADRERINVDKLNLMTADKLKKAGLQFNNADIPKLRARLGPYYGRWKSQFGPTVWALLEQYSGKFQ